MDYATLSLTEIANALEAVARDAAATFGGCDERQLNWRPDAARWSVAQIIMTSPFIRVVTYSVLDGWRIVLAHNRRHVEQARAVLHLPQFPPPAPPSR